MAAKYNAKVCYRQFTCEYVKNRKNELRKREVVVWLICVEGAARVCAIGGAFPVQHLIRAARRQAPAGTRRIGIIDKWCCTLQPLALSQAPVVIHTRLGRVQLV